VSGEFQNNRSLTLSFLDGSLALAGHYKAIPSFMRFFRELFFFFEVEGAW